MRFTTIWTIPAMSFPERLRRTRDWAARETAVRLPKRVRYWVTLMEIGKATIHSEDIMATKLDDLLHDLDSPKYVS